MPVFDPDLYWHAGATRIRANAPDPFAGLRGRAYIAARQLDRKPLERLDSKATAEAKIQSRENLIKAINGKNPRPVSRGLSQPLHFVFIRHSLIDQFASDESRRFTAIPGTARGSK